MLLKLIATTPISRSTQSNVSDSSRSTTDSRTTLSRLPNRSNANSPPFHSTEIPSALQRRRVSRPRHFGMAIAPPVARKQTPGNPLHRPCTTNASATNSSPEFRSITNGILSACPIVTGTSEYATNPSSPEAPDAAKSSANPRTLRRAMRTTNILLDDLISMLALRCRLVVAH